MRIALITHEPFYPPSGGGSAEAVYLVEEMVARGHDVHVFSPKVPEPTMVREKFKIKLHEFNTWEMGRYTKLRNFKYLLYPRFLASMVEKAAKKTPYDVILSQHAISAVAAGWLKKRLGTPVITNFLDYLTAFMETWPSYLAPRPMINALKKYELTIPVKNNVDAVLTVSDYLADLFVEAGYPREKILPIYFGYDSEIFKLQPRPPRTPGRPPQVVMHGSLDFHHLGNTAFEAVKYIHQARPDAEFRFVGHRTGAVQRLLERAAGEIPKAKVECTGFVPYADVPKYLAAADVGIVPYEESVGTHCAFAAKPVEYSALGIPMVCTPLKSVMSYFKDVPLIRFSKFDGADFGKTVVSWFDESPEWIASIGKAASEKVKADLDWRSISRKAVDRVEKVVAEKR